MLSSCNGRLYSRILRIHRRADDGVSPPVWRFDIAHCKRKEDEQCAQCQSQVQPRAGQVVQSRPPSEVFCPDILLEHISDDTPGEIVERCCWRDGGCSPKEQRCHEVLDGGFGPFAGGEIEDYGSYCTDEKEPEEPGVHLAWREDSCRTDETPDDGS